MLSLITAGSCVHPEAVVLPGGSWRPMRFPAGVGVIEHPERGVILFDTGYSERFNEVTRRFPERLYRMLTPATVQLTAAQQLAAKGLTAQEIVISHFHADHVGAAADFPGARFWCMRAAWDAVRDRRGWSAVRVGFLPALLPPDFEDRLSFLDDLPTRDLAPFGTVFELASGVVAIPLPGHTPGHVGLLIDEKTFLIGDAAWLSANVDGPRLPHAIASLAIADRYAYRRTLERLHGVRDRYEIVPSHCSRALARHAL